MFFRFSFFHNFQIVLCDFDKTMTPKMLSHKKHQTDTILQSIRHINAIHNL